MAGPLLVCPACSTHVLVRDSSCPHCGATVRNGAKVLGRTAGAVLMGLSLAACPAGDDTSESMGNGGSTSTSTSGTPGSTTDDESTTTFDVTSGPVGEAYGAPDTETFGTDPTDSSTSSGDDTDGTSGSGSDTDTDTEGTDTGNVDTEGGSTSISPLYGASPSD